MLLRRHALIAPILALPTAAHAAKEEFGAFLKGVKADAIKAGVRAAIVDQAFAGIAPNQEVIRKDRHQPEFTMTWARYKALVVSDTRIANGRPIIARERPVLGRVRDRFGVDIAPIAGIWGIESGFGADTGKFRVIEALATLAWDGRRAQFFRGELMAALKILNSGDISPAQMLGSYAGAMGQPQFMPSSYLSYAVDFEGHGRRDIWTSRPDVFGSIANYLAKAGWRLGEPWGQPVILPTGLPAGMSGSDTYEPLSQTIARGIRPLGGPWKFADTASVRVVAPDGPAGEAYVVGTNFKAIRRYNPSDYYALAVGLVGDGVSA